MQIFECREHSMVGNHRLSLVSIRRNTASCVRTNSSSSSTVFLVCSIALAVYWEEEGEGAEVNGVGVAC